MAEQAVPQYFSILDEQVWPRHQDELATRVLERTVAVEELDEKQRLAAHLLLGQYVQHRGTVKEPGAMVLPSDLVLRGLVLSRKKQTELVGVIDEQVMIAAQSHHFRPEHREADGATIVGEVPYETIDGFSLYKQKLRQLPRYEAVDNRALAEIIQAGSAAAQEITEIHDIGEASDKFSELQDQVAAGVQARNSLVEANLGLALYFAKRYKPRDGMVFDDIVQICNEALVDAANRYEYREDAGFGTHYSWYVTKHMAKSLRDEYALVRVPQLQRERSKAFVEAVKEHKGGNEGQAQSFEEIYTKLGFPARDSSAELLKAALNVNQAVTIVLCTEKNMSPTAEEYETDETTEIPQPFTEYPELIIDDFDEKADERELGRVVRAMLDGLTEHEKDIIKLRFGIRPETRNAFGEIVSQAAAPMTLDEIARVIGVTRERIRQIETRSLSKLRLRRYTTSVGDFL